MKFLAGENVEQPVVQALRAAGHDVASVRAVADGRSDREILELANREGRVLVTNDKHFADLVFREGRPVAGVLLLRLPTEDGVEKANRLADMIAQIQERLPGHPVVVGEGRVRVRPLERG